MGNHVDRLAIGLSPPGEKLAVFGKGEKVGEGFAAEVGRDGGVFLNGEGGQVLFIGLCEFVVGGEEFFLLCSVPISNNGGEFG